MFPQTKLFKLRDSDLDTKKEVSLSIWILVGGGVMFKLLWKTK